MWLTVGEGGVLGSLERHDGRVGPAVIAEVAQRGQVLLAGPGVQRRQDLGLESQRGAGVLLMRHHSPPPVSAPVVVQARSFDQQWRDVVGSYSDDVP